MQTATVTEGARSNINTIGDMKAAFLPKKKKKSEHEKCIVQNQYLKISSEVHLGLERSHQFYRNGCLQRIWDSKSIRMKFRSAHSHSLCLALRNLDYFLDGETKELYHI